MTMWTSHKL